MPFTVAIAGVATVLVALAAVITWSALWVKNARIDRGLIELEMQLRTYREHAGMPASGGEGPADVLAH